MMRRLRNLLSLHIEHDDKIVEWKLNAFYRMVSFGLCPILMPLLLLFAYYRIWQLFALVSLALGTLAFSSFLAFRKNLRLSVYITMSGSTLSTFGYLQFIHTPDGLYFMAIMIIIAGIFLGVQDAFIWAALNSALLIFLSWFLEGYSLFPQLPEFFDPAHRKAGDTYLSTIIFLYLASAFLSILFQQYFSDLLKRIRDSQEEKLLLESELLQAQKLESMGVLAGGIAHEFGHGLTRIKSCTNLILKKIADKNADLAKYAENIHSACNDINELSSKLLAFARKKSPEMANVNVHDLIESIVNIMKFLIEKDIGIQTRLEASHPTVKGNFSQLQSVLMNLTINAKDAIEREGTITFSTGHENSHLVISVSDDGAGIDEADQEKIFRPFFSSKPPDKGTGLGLPLALRIIENHKGRIDFQSKKGIGTTFRIHLPLLSSPGQAS